MRACKLECHGAEPVQTVHAEAGTTGPRAKRFRATTSMALANRPFAGRVMSTGMTRTSLKHGQYAALVLHAECRRPPTSIASAPTAKRRSRSTFRRVAGKRIDGSSGELTQRLSDYADTLDFELFGITAFDPEWVFDDMEAEGKWVVMIGVAHDYERIKTGADQRRRSRGYSPVRGAPVVRPCS